MHPQFKILFRWPETIYLVDHNALKSVLNKVAELEVKWMIPTLIFPKFLISSLTFI